MLEIKTNARPLFKCIVAVFAFGLLVLNPVAANCRGADAAPPVGVIFDTDMGNDIDDALALALIHALQNRGHCRLAAVTLTNDLRGAAQYVDVVNTFYGRGDVPIGLVRKGVRPDEDRFASPLAQKRDGDKLRYPRSYAEDYQFPDATALLRKTLAAADDRSLVIVQTGFSTNLARLLESPADAISPLDGKSLVARKVRLLSVMGGAFSQKLTAEHYCEYNIIKDVAAARSVLHDWPGEILLSGYEIGIAVEYPAESILRDYAYVAHHPVAEAYALYMKMPYDRPTWDLTSVLAAVRPDRGYFGLSPRGKVTVAGDGFTSFAPHPQGKCRYLTVDAAQISRIREAFVNLCSEPPTGNK